MEIFANHQHSPPRRLVGMLAACTAPPPALATARNSVVRFSRTRRKPSTVSREWGRPTAGQHSTAKGNSGGPLIRLEPMSPHRPFRAGATMGGDEGGWERLEPLIRWRPPPPAPVFSLFCPILSHFCPIFVPVSSTTSRHNPPQPTSRVLCPLSPPPQFPPVPPISPHFPTSCHSVGLAPVRSTCAASIAVLPDDGGDPFGRPQ